MATRKALKEFSFPVLDLDGNEITGCKVRYNREDKYSAYYLGALVGYADRKDEADQMCREAARDEYEMAYRSAK